MIILVIVWDCVKVECFDVFLYVVVCFFVVWGYSGVSFEEIGVVVGVFGFVVYWYFVGKQVLFGVVLIKVS